MRSSRRNGARNAPTQSRSSPTRIVNGRDLRNAAGWNVNLVAANLSDARLKGAGFDYARLEDADLSRALLRDTSFWEARLENAVFEYAWMERADLRGARLEGRL